MRECTSARERARLLARTMTRMSFTCPPERYRSVIERRISGVTSPEDERSACVGLRVRTSSRIFSIRMPKPCLVTR